MKKASNVLILLLCMYSDVFGQNPNMVSNGGFEYSVNNQCISNGTHVDSLIAWRQYTMGSSDHFDSCLNSISIHSGVPTNHAGYQHAAEGKSYVGFYSYLDLGVNGNLYCEYVAADITKLTVGKLYEISCLISLSNGSTYSVNDLGAYFYDNGPSKVSTATSLNIGPQVLFAISNGIVVDTQNWVKIREVFVADSAYDNMVIGSFFPRSGVTTTQIQPSLNINYDYAYYYIDSVELREVDSFAVKVADTILCAGDTISVSIRSHNVHIANNQYTIQLSDSSGSFATPISIASKSSTKVFDTVICVIPLSVKEGSSYRIRAISSNIADTSIDNQHNIRIGNLDSANVQVSSSVPACSGDTLNLIVNHNAVSISFLWNGPNSFISTAQSPGIASVNSNHSGLYYLKTIIHGCVQNDTVNVSVVTKPSTPTVSSNSAVCSGDTLKLISSTTTAGVSYNWQGPNSFSSTVQNPVIVNAGTNSSGLYTVTVTKNGCSNSDTTSVVVLASPQNITANSNSPLCDGDTILLTATSGGTGVTYSWSGPSNYSSTFQNPSINNAATTNSGTYAIVASLNNCKKTDSVMVIVNAIPAQPALSYNNPLCYGELLVFTASNVTGATYSWSGPNSFSSNSQNPTRNNVNANDTGLYSVTTTIANCTSLPVAINVSINQIPFVVIFSNKDTLCDGESITFNSLPTNAGTKLQYQWYVNAQAMIGSNQSTYSTTQLKNNDVVTLYMTDSTQCSSPLTDQSNDVDITVIPWLSPSVSISVNPTGPVPQDSFLTFSAMAIDAGNPPIYQWERNGSDILGATGNVWSANTLNDNDSISVEIESTYKCPQPKTANSNGIVVRILTDVSELNNIIKNVQLYPNPNDGTFTLKGMLNAETIKATVYNTAGQVVLDENVDVTNNRINHQFNISNLTNGIYLLNLNVDGEKSVLKFSVH